MREALYPISQDTSVQCLILLEHGHIREETVIYEDYFCDRLLILPFTRRNHVVSLFLDVAVMFLSLELCLFFVVLMAHLLRL